MRRARALGDLGLAMLHPKQKHPRRDAVMTSRIFRTFGRWLPLWLSWRCETSNEAKDPRSHMEEDSRGTDPSTRLRAGLGNVIRIDDAGRHRQQFGLSLECPVSAFAEKGDISE